MAQKAIKLEPLVWLRALVTKLKKLKELPRAQQLAWAAIAVGVILIVIGLLI